MSERLRRVRVVVTLLATVALMASAVFAGEAAAQLKAPPKSVLVLKAAWSAGEIPGSPSFIPASSFQTASQQASDRLKSASHGFFVGWSTTVRGPFQIAAPRAVRDSEDPRRVECEPEFFSDLTTRTDAAARAAGVNPDAHDLVVYTFDEAICTSMPEANFGAGLLDSRRLVFQGEMPAGNLVHMVGHYIGLGHAGSIRCTDPQRGPVPLEPFKEAERCTTNPADDPYDVMGAGRDASFAPGGVYSAPVQNALGWLGDDPEFQIFWNVAQRDPTRTFELVLNPLSDATNRTFDKRAIRFEEGGNVFWIEYRDQVGVDSGLRATPGLIVRRELGRTVAGAPVTQLLDMTPTTPMGDAGLPINQTWTNPGGPTQITFLSLSDDGSQALVRLGTKPGLPPAPLPHPVPPAGQLPDPNRSMLVINVGWSAPDPADAAPLNLTYEDKTAAMINETMNQFYRRSAPPGHYLNRTAYVGGSYTIQTPRLNSGKPLSSCKDQHSDDADGLKDLLRGRGEALAQNAGLEPDRFRHLVVVYSRSFCGFGGNYNRPSEDILIARRDPGVLYHEFGHYLGLRHAEALRCRTAGGVFVTLSQLCDRVEYADPIDPMGDGNFPGTFGPVNAKALGWMDEQFYSLTEGSYTAVRTIKPFGETVPDGRPRAIRLVDGNTTLWLDFRAQVGTDLFQTPPFPEDGGSGTAIPSGLYIHREVLDPGFLGIGDGVISQLIDMSPNTGFGDSDLEVGQTWANPLGTMQITLNSAAPSGATVTITKKQVPVVVPNLSGKTIAEASSALQAVGLAYGGISKTVDDCNGDSVSRVVSQVPSAGTNVASGTAVTVAVGRLPTNTSICQ